MNATVTPHEYVQAKGWDLVCIAESADDHQTRNADKYVKGGADALRAYCQRRVREPVEYRADSIAAPCKLAQFAALSAETLPGRFEGLGDTLSL